VWQVPAASAVLLWAGLAFSSFAEIQDEPEVPLDSHCPDDSVPSRLKASPTFLAGDAPEVGHEVDEKALDHLGSGGSSAPDRRDVTVRSRKPTSFSVGDFTQPRMRHDACANWIPKSKQANSLYPLGLTGAQIGTQPAPGQMG
jgi:hypothetical protein